MWLDDIGQPVEQTFLRRSAPSLCAPGIVDDIGVPLGERSCCAGN
jgi:hypothetical protein